MPHKNVSYKGIHHIGMIYIVIRGVECAESVSMRDVKRCMTLLHWFSKHLLSAKNKATEIQPMVLALAHCYYCRLGTTELRRKYLGICKHGKPYVCDLTFITINWDQLLDCYISGVIIQQTYCMRLSSMSSVRIWRQ